MSGKNESWTTIESDPGVFTQLVELMGVKGVQFEELYSLEKSSLDALRPVYGLIFLFKWQKEKDEPGAVEEMVNPNVFFAKQVIPNACATQAILAVLLNSSHLELGSELASFREFTADFPPEFKGLSISNSDSIRAAHNSFARPEPIISDESTSGRGEDAFHFITYVPVDGVLYELDGLKEGPIALGKCADTDWLDLAGPAIQQRIERYTASEIRFNLLAVCQDRRIALQQRLAEVQALRQQAVARGTCSSMQVDDGARSAGGDETAAATAGIGAHEDSQVSVSHLDDEAARLEEQVLLEQQRRQDWHDENLRRKHNYIPLIFNLLKLMAEKQQLAPLLAEALYTSAGK